MFTDVKELISWIESQKRVSHKVSLDKMRSYLEIYSNPQNGKKYVHVGGTNGKGSTVSYIKTTLVNAGYNVGAYVSPYVISFNERIQYNNEYISDDDILSIGNYMISKYNIIEEEGLDKPTFFEFVTIMAFLYFNSIKDLDIIVLEVGMGGLLDCTNVITPIISVITNIAFDHMKILGNTLPEIAANKLGIVKDGKPLVTLENDAVNDLFFNKCQEKSSELFLVKKENIKDIVVTKEYTSFSYKNFTNIRTNLLGYYQTENASIALETLCYLREKCDFNITDRVIYDSFKNIFWPGRLQILSKNPYIIIDGAHNIDGITRLAEFLKAIKNNRKMTIMFAVSKDKAKDEMISVLDDIADEIVFTMFNYKRSDTPEYLFDISKNPNKKISFDVKELLKEAFSKEKNEIVVFCGSLYFVSEILSDIKTYKF